MSSASADMMEVDTAGASQQQPPPQQGQENPDTAGNNNNNDGQQENDNDATTTAVSLWFSKPKNKHQCRYSVVAAWSYKASTKQLRYALWKDQGPAPYLSTLSSWISGQQPQVVYVSCGTNQETLQQDKNLALWMQDVHEDLQQQQQQQQEPHGNSSNNNDNDTPEDAAAAPQNTSRVVPSVVPPQAHKDGIEMLRALVADDSAALYQLQGNPDLKNVANVGSTPPLICAAAVLLEAMGLYQGGGAGVVVSDPLAHQVDNNGNTERRFSIQAMPATTFMVLDRAASSSLNVWPVAHAGQAALEGATAWHTSLYGLLSHYARTSMGKTLLQQWLLHPLIQLQPLLQRQEAVAFFVENGLLRQGVAEQGLATFNGTHLEKLVAQLESFPDLPAHNPNDDENDDDMDVDDADQKPTAAPTFTGSTRKVLQTLYELYTLASQKVPALVEQLQPIVEQQQGDNNSNDDELQGASFLLQQHTGALLDSANELSRAVDLCEAVLDLDLAPREFVVKAEHSERLGELSRELVQWQAELEDCHEEMNQQWIEAAGLNPSSGSNGKNNKYVRLNIPEKANGDTSYDYQFRLPNQNDAKKLQDKKKFPGGTVTVHRILKNGVYFSTTKLKQLASHRADLDRQYDRVQRSWVAQAMGPAKSYAPVVQAVRHSVAVVDALCAMAQLAVFSPNGTYCRPTLTDSNEDGHGIVLQQARHPCVERQETVQDFIPNDIQLTLGPKSCWLVTGPNMGGKSTFIRSVGAIVTLAQMGSYVPCESAQINLIHAIYARVGAGDSQDRGISTFMSEMLEASAILQTANRRSLIIVDELGRGTSTNDGYGLARSICEYIVEKLQCLTVFATHFHEITSTLPQQFPKGEVHNCHVSAVTRDKQVVFLYKVEDGPCTESFGIPVAEMAQVPHQVILDAKVALQQLQDSMSSSSTTKRPLENDNDNNSEQQDNADEQWLSKFRKIDVPQLLKDAGVSATGEMDPAASAALQQQLLQALQ